jgi:hypothetical protein
MQTAPGLPQMLTGDRLAGTVKSTIMTDIFYAPANLRTLTAVLSRQSGPFQALEKLAFIQEVGGQI